MACLNVCADTEVTVLLIARATKHLVNGLLGYGQKRKLSGLRLADVAYLYLYGGKRRFAACNLAVKKRDLFRLHKLALFKQMPRKLVDNAPIKK